MKVNLRSEFWETTFFVGLYLFSCSCFSNNIFGDFELSHARFFIFIGISSYWMESVSLFVSCSITVLNENFENKIVIELFGYFLDIDAYVMFVGITDVA